MNTDHHLASRELHLAAATKAKRRGDKVDQRFSLTMAKHHLRLALVAAVGAAIA